MKAPNLRDTRPRKPVHHGAARMSARSNWRTGSNRNRGKVRIYNIREQLDLPARP